MSCQHEPLAPPEDPHERVLEGGVVAEDDRHYVLPRASYGPSYTRCQHCGEPMRLPRDIRRRVTRSWLIDHGYADPFA